MIEQMADHARGDSSEVLQANRVLSEDSTHFLLTRHSLINTKADVQTQTSSAQSLPAVASSPINVLMVNSQCGGGSNVNLAISGAPIRSDAQQTTGRSQDIQVKYPLLTSQSRNNSSLWSVDSDKDNIESISTVHKDYQTLNSTSNPSEVRTKETDSAIGEVLLDHEILSNFQHESEVKDDDTEARKSATVTADSIKLDKCCSKIKSKHTVVPIQVLNLDHRDQNDQSASASNLSPTQTRERSSATAIVLNSSNSTRYQEISHPPIHEESGNSGAVKENAIATSGLTVTVSKTVISDKPLFPSNMFDTRSLESHPSDCDDGVSKSKCHNIFAMLKKILRTPTK